MFPRVTLLASAVFALGSVVAPAQTLYTYDDSVPYSPNSYVNNGVYSTGSVDYDNQTGNASSPYSATPDLRVTLATADGVNQTEMLDVCAQLFVGPTGLTDFTITEGFGSLNANQQTAARILFSNVYDEFFVARDTLTTDPDVVGAAIQLAFWEITDDPSGALVPSIDDGAAFAGDLSILNFTGGYTGDTADAVALAESYLSNIRNATWSDQGGLNYYYADSATEQDRFWVSRELIPEPSTAILGLLGGLFLLRRRR